MSEAIPGGRLAANVMHFARLLRAAGLAIGTDRVLDAVRTLEALGVERREDVYWALRALFVRQPTERELFDRAFRLFWRVRGGYEEALAALLPVVERPGDPRAQVPRRLAEAWGGSRPRPPRERRSELDAGWTASDREVLHTKDFAEMSAAEIREAQRWIAKLRLPVPPRRTRRWRPDPSGRRPDLRASLRAGLRAGGRDIPLRWRAPVRRPPPLVVLCDISGSMERYSRILLHFVFALARSRQPLHAFLFGTRLTPITRTLRRRDVDAALAALGRGVPDWSGGTRIGACLREFNRRWSRRVLAQGAVVILISDGLERDDPEALDREAARLRRSCQRLIWLNPLLGYEDFEPLARGIRALLGHVDDFRPVHNLVSLEALARALTPAA